MIKFVDTKVVFRELPNEITLAINISGCPCACQGCHSSYLAQNIGTQLSPEILQQLINGNKGISAVCFMGGDSSPVEITCLAEWIKKHTSLHVGWYSGRQELSPDITLKYFDYIKLGPYIASYGPLSDPHTNQRMYAVKSLGENDEFGNPIYDLHNITSSFYNKSI